MKDDRCDFTVCTYVLGYCRMSWHVSRYKYARILCHNAQAQSDAHHVRRRFRFLIYPSFLPSSCSPYSHTSWFQFGQVSQRHPSSPSASFPPKIRISKKQCNMHYVYLPICSTQFSVTNFNPKQSQTAHRLRKDN